MAAIAAFAGCLGATFVFDDHSLFSAQPVTFPTRPLAGLTFWMNRQLSDAPWSWHLVNLLLHALAAWMVWNTLRRLLPERAALIAAVLFAVHPLQTEAVTYVFARPILLATIFCLLALRWWLAGRVWLAAAWFALALLSKEEVAAFPLFLALLNLAERRPRGEWPALAVMASLAVGAAVRVMTIATAGSGAGAGAASGIPWWQYLAAQGPAILRYLRLLLFPYGFTIDPDIPIPGAAVAVLCWALILAGAAFAARRCRGGGPAFWMLAALLLLLPSSSVFPASDLAVDRRTYLPLFAVSAAAGLALSRLRPAYPVVLCACLCLISEARTKVWWTEESLWTEALERAPRKLRPKLQLARVIEPARAETLLLAAQREAPDEDRIPAELGRLYLAGSRPTDALRAFGRALALDPGSALYRNNRGVALAALGQVDAARTDFEAALRMDGCLVDARNNLARLGVSTPAPPDCR